MRSGSCYFLVAAICVGALSCTGQGTSTSTQEAGGTLPASGGTSGGQRATSSGAGASSIVSMNPGGGSTQVAAAANSGGASMAQGGRSSSALADTTGGIAAIGGLPSTGGTASASGSQSVGGSRTVETTVASSGGSPTGGSPASGGAKSASGGAAVTGGTAAKGGATAAPMPLANYVRTQGPLTLSGISDASGVAWKPETDTFFIVSNGTHSLYEYTPDFKTRLRTIVLNSGGTDTEDVVYLGANRFGVVDEENEVYVVTIPDGATSANMAATDAERYVVSAPPATTNRGFEGVTIRPNVGANGQFIVCQEGGVAGTPIRVLFFNRSTSSGTFDYANGSLSVQEPWNALTMLGSKATDLSALCFDTASSTLLVLSQESSRLLRVVPESGAILDERDLSGSPQYEGLTLASGGRLVLVSEPNYVEVYVAN